MGTALMGFFFGPFLIANLMSPYSFLAFNYGAFQYIELFPNSGVGQDIKDVMDGKSLGTSGIATFNLGLSILNTLTGPRNAPISVYWPGVPY